MKTLMITFGLNKTEIEEANMFLNMGALKKGNSLLPKGVHSSMLYQHF